MLIKSNMFILLLVTRLFVSCKFLEIKAQVKINKMLLCLILLARLVNLGSKSLTALGKATVQRRGLGITSSSVVVFAFDDPVIASGVSGSPDKQEEATCKLTEDDKDKLNAFLARLQNINFVYNLFITNIQSAYNTIDTYYGSCYTYRNGCFIMQGLLKNEGNLLLI